MSYTGLEQRWSMLPYSSSDQASDEPEDGTCPGNVAMTDGNFEFRMTIVAHQKRKKNFYMDGAKMGLTLFLYLFRMDSE
jgi:hypothetical protein